MKQVRVYDDNPQDCLCPHMKAINRASKFRHTVECDLSKKLQKCYDEQLCTMWKKVRDE